MSAITLTTIAQTARNRLNLSPTDEPRLKTLVGGALQSLALKVARRADFEAMRTEIPVVCTAGVITLADSTILVEVLLETGELIIDGKFAKPAPTYQELTLKLPADVYRWSLKTPTKIHVTDLTTGALGTVNKNGTLAFNSVPTLATMLDNYDKELVDQVVLLAGGKVEEAPAPEFEGKDKGMSVNLNTA